MLVIELGSSFLFSIELNVCLQEIHVHLNYKWVVYSLNGPILINSGDCKPFNAKQEKPYKM